MALIAPAYETINPSMMLPEIILPYSQASGAFDLLPDGEPKVMLGDGDLVVYIRRLDLRSKTTTGQVASNIVQSPDIVMSQISNPTYLMRMQADYDHHDMSAAGRNGFSLVEATRLASQQGLWSTARIALLYGLNPANGEGILNSNGATAINLPPDSNGNTTVITYDNGQMAFFLQQQVLAIKTRTNNLGIGNEFVYIGPQRTLGLFEYNVVQTTQFQRIGAGTTSTANVVKEVLMANGDKVIWAYDDTLIGKGAGGTDAVIVAMPRLKKPMNGNAGKWNTNRFADVSTGMEDCLQQLTDMVAPREITVPLAHGAVNTLFEQRITSGWGIRPEAISIVSMQFQ